MRDQDDRRRLLAIGIITAAVAVVLALRFLAVGSGMWCRVPTGAMVPTIPVGAHVLTNPLAYRHEPPRRLDLVTFRYPLEPSILYLKRVIGLPGETVEIRAKVVFINGKPLNEPYIIHDDPTVFPDQPSLPEPYRSRDYFGPITMPPNTFFMMGDNRDRSADSRYWGGVDRRLIRGRVVHIFR
jgi:signal peptidase I